MGYISNDMLLVSNSGYACSYSEWASRARRVTLNLRTEAMKAAEAQQTMSDRQDELHLDET